MKAKVIEIELIDKSVLAAEIKRRIDDELKIINKFTHSFYKYEITRCNARIALLKQLQEFLDTLEVKKVGLKTFPELQESEDDQFKSDIVWLEKEEPQVYETKDGEIITYSEEDGYKM